MATPKQTHGLPFSGLEKPRIQKNILKVLRLCRDVGAVNGMCRQPSEHAFGKVVRIFCRILWSKYPLWRTFCSRGTIPMGSYS